MRIRELLESKYFRSEDFVSADENGKDINFDLVDDLVHFMNNDDDIYRRHLYPKIAECLDQYTANRPTKSSIFKNAVDQGYQVYRKRFPIKELPSNLDEEMVKQVCNKLHDDLKQHISDGHYKD